MADTFSDALAAVSNQFKNPVPVAAPAPVQQSPFMADVSGVGGSIRDFANKVYQDNANQANVVKQYFTGTPDTYASAKSAANPSPLAWFTGAAQAGQEQAAPPPTSKALPTAARGVNTGPLEAGGAGVQIVGQPYTSTPQEVALAAKNTGVTPEQAHAVLNAHTQSENDFLNAVRGMPRNQMNALVGHAMQLRMDPRTQATQNYLDMANSLAAANALANDKTQPDDVRARAAAAVTNPATQMLMSYLERLITPGTFMYPNVGMPTQ